MINGNNFVDMADYAITLDNPVIDNIRLATADIIYCKTDYIKRLFAQVQQYNKRYILITGMADKPIHLQPWPDNIVRWYAVNALAPNTIPIPLGTENHKGKSKGGYTDHAWLYNNIDMLRDTPKKNILYCNWSNKTNVRVRSGLTKKLKHLPLQVDSGLPYYEYCRRMAGCKYVACPAGNGIDTHRVWEALYLGCIPIVQCSRVFDTYQLPIIQIDDWCGLDKRVLDIEYTGDYRQLYMPYWRTRIKEDANLYLS